MSKEIIQALKGNLKRYDRLTHDENATLESIGYEYREYLNTSKGIWEQVGMEGGRPEDTVFRIVPDYEAPEAPEAEVATLKGMQGCAWEDAEGDTIAAVNELQDVCGIIIDTVQAMIESKQ